MITKFVDMHSGGGSCEKWEYIYIKAPLEEAKIKFQAQFGHDPERVSCACCGQDYWIEEYKTINEATKGDRGNMTVKKYLKQKGVKMIAR
jgi:hypothetical protein